MLKLGLSPEQIAARRLGIGGSDAPKIMKGEWYDLWAEKTGRKEPDDLSRVLPVQLGSFTEEFNAHWYELTTGNTVGDRGRHCISAEHPFMRCNLDGVVPALNAIWQAKHVAGREPVETVVQRYVPQVTHEMIVAGYQHAVLSLLIGTDKFEAVNIDLDEFYAIELIEREREFWSYVTTDRPPPDAPAIKAPLAIKEMRKVDMTGSNRWSMFAGDYLATKGPAATFKVAEAGLKALVEPDVCEAAGHGIIIRRDKRGLSIKEIA